MIARQDPRRRPSRRRVPAPQAVRGTASRTSCMPHMVAPPPSTPTQRPASMPRRPVPPADRPMAVSDRQPTTLTRSSNRAYGQMPFVSALRKCPGQAGGIGGAEGNRTPDLCSAIAALSHLSYSPDRLGRGWGPRVGWAPFRGGPPPLSSALVPLLHGGSRRSPGARKPWSASSAAPPLAFCRVAST